MGYENKYRVTTIQALEDLNTHQYQAIALDDGEIANSGQEAVGILINKPKNGEHAEIAYEGEIKFRAGGAISIHKPITVTTSGYFVDAGSGYFVVGRAKATVTSGSIGTGLFNFKTPIYAYSSSQAW